SDAASSGSAWWRDGWASCRSSPRGRTSGRAGDEPTASPTAGTPRSRAIAASPFGCPPRGCIRPPSDPPLVDGDGDAIADLRQELVDRRDHLGALPDRGRHALDRPGTHVADREDAVATRLEPPPIDVGAGADESLVVEGHIG